MYARSCAYRRMIPAIVLLLVAIGEIGSAQVIAGEKSTKSIFEKFVAAPGEHDYTATIKIKSGKKHKTKDVLATATFTIADGDETCALECGKKYRLEVTVQTDEKHSQPLHAIQIKLLHADGKEAKPLMAPRVIMTDGGSCFVAEDQPNGNELQLTVTVSQQPWQE
jgi:hypothetical protein